MEIRLAQTGDIPGLMKLLHQVEEVHQKIRPDVFRPGAVKYTEDMLVQLLADPARPIYVAMEKGEMMGYAFCILKEVKDDHFLMDQRTFYIDDLCVEETCRGKHVGKALYEYVCARGRELGCSSITLNVWCGNDSAMAFYEKRGLKPRNIHMEMRLED